MFIKLWNHIVATHPWKQISAITCKNTLYGHLNHIELIALYDCIFTEHPPSVHCFEKPCLWISWFWNKETNLFNVNNNVDPKIQAFLTKKSYIQVAQIQSQTFGSQKFNINYFEVNSEPNIQIAYPILGIPDIAIEQECSWTNFLPTKADSPTADKNMAERTAKHSDTSLLQWPLLLIR